MATAAQILANQANAQNSTGPRTDAGKASSSQNARTHGLLSKSILILPGQESDFETLAAGLTEELEPFGPFENLLFDNILHAAWNQHRCRLAERQLYLQAAKPDLDPILNADLRQQLRLVQTYGSRAERSFKSAAELRRVQTEMQYRIEADITHPASPLIELKAVLPQRITERLRHNQANLTAIRACCETPPDAAGLNSPPSAYVPVAAPIIAAPATPAEPQPRAESAAAKPKDPVRGGFARSTIFRRNKNKH